MFRIAAALLLQFFAAALLAQRQGYIYRDMETSTLTQVDPTYRHAPAEAVSAGRTGNSGCAFTGVFTP